MTEKTTITIHDCMASAFQSLLRGETDTRDKLCAMVGRTFAAHNNTELPGDTPIVLGKEARNDQLANKRITTKKT
jgi:hypothetical protein